jgi:hypothetical protein
MPTRLAANDWAPLLVRRNPLRQWSEKEWWFAYAWDPAARFYVSWAFVRAFYGDHFGIVAFQEGDGAPVTLQRSLILDRVERGGRLCLENAGRLHVGFSEDAGRFAFSLAAGEWSAELSVAPSPLPPFVRREDQFVRHYSVIHTYGNPVEGTVTVGGKTRTLRTDRSYLDHCYGDVPSRTGWHWLAVQNEETALTSLVNYGPHAQLYTHVLHGGSWIRLGQDVSFDARSLASDGRWRLTSPDLDLTVEPLGRNVAVTRMPPLLPLLANLTHAEHVVRASGGVRVEGRWVEHAALVGVMEEHFGRW